MHRTVAHAPTIVVLNSFIPSGDALSNAKENNEKRLDILSSASRNVSRTIDVNSTTESRRVFEVFFSTCSPDVRHVVQTCLNYSYQLQVPVKGSTGIPNHPTFVLRQNANARIYATGTTGISSIMVQE